MRTIKTSTMLAYYALVDLVMSARPNFGHILLPTNFTILLTLSTYMHLTTQSEFLNINHLVTYKQINQGLQILQLKRD